MIWKLLFLAVTSCLMAQDDLRGVFERIYIFVPDDSGVVRANENATYAWGVSYHMLADVRMYQATGETVYLDRALDKMANILDNRDDHRGRADFRGVVMPAWRNVHYQLPAGQTYRYGDPDNDRYGYCYAVHSGMITYPMAALAEEIKKRGVEGGSFKGLTYQEWADELITRAAETVAAHDEEWVAHGEDEGYYRFADFPPHFTPYANRLRDVPFNKSHTLASTMIVLWRLTGDARYYDKILRLATRFKRSLKLTPEGAYVWLYWQRPGVYQVSGTGEDISHAALNVTFAHDAFQTGLVFDEEDMRRFARTLAALVLRSPARSVRDACGREFELPNISDAVTGGAAVNGYWNAVIRWFELARFDPEVWPRVDRVMNYIAQSQICGRPAAGGPTMLLGQALALLYKPATLPAP